MTRVTLELTDKVATRIAPMRNCLLSSDEERELDELEKVEHIFVMLKAKGYNENFTAQ